MRAPSSTESPRALEKPAVVITGGTGFLGKAVVRELLSAGEHVRVLARREPAAWERVSGAEYRVADLGAPLPDNLLAGAKLVIHAAAETAGGWAEHQRNSLDATAHVIRAAAAAGIRDVIHVSSVAVLRSGSVFRDDSPLEPKSKGSGPYVWGKLESERLAVSLGSELGLAVHVVRPGAIVDMDAYEPPGRLGKRLGNVFIAPGQPGQRLGVVELAFAARVLRWMAQNPAESPERVNLVSPGLISRRELIAKLRENNPDLSVVWLPTPLLVPLSWIAIGLQKLLRPGKPAINVARVFAAERYDTSGVEALAARVERASVARVN